MQTQRKYLLIAAIIVAIGIAISVLTATLITRVKCHAEYTKGRTIILLGDSITEWSTNPMTQGFHAMLQRDYVRKADIVNRGLSGHTTR